MSVKFQVKYDERYSAYVDIITIDGNFAADSDGDAEMQAALNASLREVEQTRFVPTVDTSC